MSNTQNIDTYKRMIDSLVDVCNKGQGQVGANRVRRGVWNPNANQNFLSDQHAINELLSRMSEEDRDVIARMLTHQVEVGVFETLKVLEQNNIAPFQEAFEGSPYHDFMGRLTDWQWPST